VRALINLAAECQYQLVYIKREIEKGCEEGKRREKSTRTLLYGRHYLNKLM
jgi:hypothetical protein